MKIRPDAAYVMLEVPSDKSNLFSFDEAGPSSFLSSERNAKLTEFYVDSCASNHSVKDVSHVIDRYSTTTTVKMANGHLEDLRERGSIAIPTRNGKVIQLDNALLAENYPHNLLSVPKIMQAGDSVLFQQPGQGVTLTYDDGSSTYVKGPAIIGYNLEVFPLHAHENMICTLKIGQDEQSLRKTPLKKRKVRQDE